MKSNIQRINYDGTLNPNGKWYKWHETCDRCGADCEKDDFMTLQAPNTTEKDYCLKCLRELLELRRNGH